MPLKLQAGMCIVIATTALLEQDMGIFSFCHVGRHPKDVRQKVLMVLFDQAFVGMCPWDTPWCSLCFTALSSTAMTKSFILDHRISVRFPEAFQLGCCGLSSLFPCSVSTGSHPISSPAKVFTSYTEAQFKIKEGSRSQEDKGP